MFNLLKKSGTKSFCTCGGVGVVADLPPDIISSVMSRPPWLGSRILICWSKNIKYITLTCNYFITTYLQLPNTIINITVIIQVWRKFWIDQTNFFCPFISFRAYCWVITGLRSLFGGPCDCAGGCWGGGACCCCWAGLIMTGAG